ncbi:hypothetical protein NDU88_003540 [Pleurodeles waltl]|uniref:Uncharacterized protein n=1 Tax=Pleurodeles waltl TaxID=8319 RepID=A0AAV7VG26_PLEWA|nr:hypothetical protein NDU88_003540 [Pleurodeles waltl]
MYQLGLDKLPLQNAEDFNTTSESLDSVASVTDFEDKTSGILNLEVKPQQCWLASDMKQSCDGAGIAGNNGTPFPREHPGGTEDFLAEQRSSTQNTPSDIIRPSYMCADKEWWCLILSKKRRSEEQEHEKAIVDRQAKEPLSSRGMPGAPERWKMAAVVARAPQRPRV